MEDKKYNALYEKAEKFLEKQGDAKDFRPSDMLGIMQEINTYRVELDMQNDELQRTRLELEESRDKYKNLFNLAPVAHLTIDKDDTILEANKTSMKLFDVNNLKGKSLSTFITSKSQDDFYLYKQKLFETMRKQLLEVEFKLANGTKFKALLQGIAILEEKKQIIHIIINDLSEINTKH